MIKIKMADQVNIWYSPHIKKYVSCCLIVKGELLKREKTQHDTLDKALNHALANYISIEQKENK